MIHDRFERKRLPGPAGSRSKTSTVQVIELKELIAFAVGQNFFDFAQITVKCIFKEHTLATDHGDGPMVRIDQALLVKDISVIWAFGSPYMVEELLPRGRGQHRQSFRNVDSMDGSEPFEEILKHTVHPVMLFGHMMDCMIKRHDSMHFPP